MVRRKTRRFRCTSFSRQNFQDADLDATVRCSTYTVMYQLTLQLLTWTRQRNSIIVRNEERYSFEKEGKVSYVCIEGAETWKFAKHPGNYPPTPPLTQHLPQARTYFIVGLGEGWVGSSPKSYTTYYTVVYWSKHETLRSQQHITACLPVALVDFR